MRRNDLCPELYHGALADTSVIIFKHGTWIFFNNEQLYKSSFLISCILIRQKYTDNGKILTLQKSKQSIVPLYINI